jgi:hypothetical protein
MATLINTNTVLLRSQSQGGRALIRFTGSGGAIVQGNTSQNSDISDSGHPADPIQGGSITGAWWSIAGNTATVARGANNTLLTLSGSGFFSQAQNWQGDGSLPTSNIVVTFGTGAVGTLYLEVTKTVRGFQPA